MNFTIKIKRRIVNMCWYVWAKWIFNRIADVGTLLMGITAIWALYKAPNWAKTIKEALDYWIKIIGEEVARWRKRAQLEKVYSMAVEMLTVIDTAADPQKYSKTLEEDMQRRIDLLTKNGNDYVRLWNSVDICGDTEVQNVYNKVWQLRAKFVGNLSAMPMDYKAFYDKVFGDRITNERLELREEVKKVFKNYLK
jgi:hypothetical protein